MLWFKPHKRPHLIQGSSYDYSPNPGIVSRQFTPVIDNLEEGSVIEDWIPRDLPGLNTLFRRIYLRGGIEGPAIDIQSMLPWSTWGILGVEDPHVHKFYEDALIPLFTPEVMEEITKEYLILGRFCASLTYDMGLGYWTSMTPHDSDFLEITPVPVKDYDPIIDMRVGRGLQNFLSSKDPRTIIPKNLVPRELLGRSAGGKIPLNPFNTLWVARCVSPADYVGTSVLTRIIPYWAIEKALLDSTAVGARRVAGGLLHLKIGIDELWEPSDEEIQNIAQTFVQADMDIIGSVVATRTGVETNQVRQGGSGNVWKISDDGAFINEGKMHALGINDAFLSGEASYTSYEQAASIVMEQIRTLRDRLTAKTIIKMATLLAQVHGFRKRKQAHLDHRIRIKDDVLPHEETKQFRLLNLPMREALSIPKHDLVLPGVGWSKSLRPEGDMHLIELLSTLEEKGLPVTIRDWALAGGRNVDEILKGLDDDNKLRDKINKWKASKDSTTETEDGDDLTADFAIGSIGYNKMPFWNNGPLMDVTKGAFIEFLNEIKGKDDLLKDKRGLISYIRNRFKNRKADVISYLLMRVGLVPHGFLPIDNYVVSELFSWIRRSITARTSRERESLLLSRMIHCDDYKNADKKFNSMSQKFASNIKNHDLELRLKSELKRPNKHPRLLTA